MAEANKKNQNRRLSVIILAAGTGKRMHSQLPKVLHPLGGIPLLLHVIRTAQSLSPASIQVVYGQSGKRIREQLANVKVNWVRQAEPKGTGHALLQALPQVADDQRVLVLYGDVPLIQPTTLERLLHSTDFNELGLLVAHLENPSGFGRIIRNEQNKIVAIVEHKDATAEQLAIQEINTGILTASAAFFKKWLPQLKNSNAQNEYYLTDAIAIAVRENIAVNSILAPCNKEVSGVNDRKELVRLERHYQLQMANQFLMQGVSILDPNRFDCRGEVVIAKDVQIDVNVILQGSTRIGEGTTIGPNTLIINSEIGENVTIMANCVIENAKIADNCQIGPFARIRPNTELKENVHIGNFVELKNTKIKQDSKVNHLTYLGDAEVGQQVNVGAGTITCNYDGVDKFATIIQDGAFIGSGTELVAPITIGKNAYIGAGSTITKDAPDGQLTLGRSRQITVKGWKKNANPNS